MKLLSYTGGPTHKDATIVRPPFLPLHSSSPVLSSRAILSRGREYNGARCAWAFPRSGATKAMESGTIGPLPMRP